MKGRLIIFCGLPSSGKTTIAALVASALGNAVHIQTDTFRFMFAKPSYSREESSFVYNAMYQVGREALTRGFDAILDATFLKEDYRQEAARKLSRYYSSLVYISVSCSLKLVLERNEKRIGAAVVPKETLLRFHKILEKPKNAIFVNTTRRSPESSAVLILKRLKNSDKKSAQRKLVDY